MRVGVYAHTRVHSDRTINLNSASAFPDATHKTSLTAHTTSRREIQLCWCEPFGLSRNASPRQMLPHTITAAGEFAREKESRVNFQPVSCQCGTAPSWTGPVVCGMLFAFPASACPLKLCQSLPLTSSPGEDTAPSRLMSPTGLTQDSQCPKHHQSHSQK